MGFTATYIPYRQTGCFSRMVNDYLDNSPSLQPFYNYIPDISGIKKAITARKKFKTDRKLLVAELTDQYKNLSASSKLNDNIKSLLSEDTFTICTAHQPNIFTGHLYFIYKIVHTIRLADELNKEISGKHFVPVFYMGTEDADLDELGEIHVNGKKYQWQTNQKGAVGRMKIDKDFTRLIDELEGQLSVEKYGKEIMALVRKAYTKDKTIEQATLEFVHELFADFGLIIFLPDNPAYKKLFHEINQKELVEQFSHKLVEETIEVFPAEYKVQAAGREINLFYLKDDIRERISKEGEVYKVQNTAISFSANALMDELKQQPERFSQNVILRPVFQELVLPNIAFIGGGGELAYWLELKKVFDAVHVPFPVLVLRNSFSIVTKKVVEKMNGLQLNAIDFFKEERALIDELVKKESSVTLDLSEERASLVTLYHNLKVAAGAADSTLQGHVEALEKQAIKRVEVLEKKMLRAEKRKFEAQQRHIHKVKEQLFPSGVLQERVDNLLPYYAVFGKELVKMIYDHSRGLQQEFCIVEEV